MKHDYYLALASFAGMTICVIAFAWACMPSNPGKIVQKSGSKAWNHWTRWNHCKKMSVAPTKPLKINILYAKEPLEPQNTKCK